jgi:polysaccharide biosynthesis protein PslH
MTRLLSIVPFPPRLDAPQGGPRALAELLTRLAERMPVSLIALRAAPEPPVDDALLDRCELVRVVARPTPQRWTLRQRIATAASLARGVPAWAHELAAPEMHEAVADVARTWRPDVAQVDFGVMGQYLPSVPTGIPTVLVVHDLIAGSPLLDDDAGVGERLRERLDRRAWGRFDATAFRRSDAVVVFSARDRRLVEAASGRTPVQVIPLGIRLGRALDPVGSEPAVVFVGSFVHPPNVDAARFLAREILPRVRSRRPETTAYIVGDAPPREVRELAGDSVVVTGRVPAVEPYLDRAAVVAAPVRLGGGMRVKVLDALGAGKAVVSTALGVSGLSVEDGEHVLVRERPEEFAEAIAGLVASPDRRRELGRAARAWAETHTSWEATADAYERLYTSLVPRSHPTRASDR